MEWDGMECLYGKIMGMGTNVLLAWECEWDSNLWEWEGIGKLKVIPTHLYFTPYTQAACPSITVESLLCNQADATCRSSSSLSCCLAMLYLKKTRNLLIGIISNQMKSNQVYFRHNEAHSTQTQMAIKHTRRHNKGANTNTKFKNDLKSHTVEQ